MGSRGVSPVLPPVANTCDFPTKSHKSALSPAAERREKVRFNNIQSDLPGRSTTVLLPYKIQYD